MKKILTIITIILLMAGCGMQTYKEQTKEDIEKFNEAYHITENEMEANNKIVYVNFEEVEELLKSNSGIIFLGNSDNAESQSIISPLIKATNLINTNVYYFEPSNDEKLSLGDKLKDKIVEISSTSYAEIPIILFVKKGKIVDYIYGPACEEISSQNYDKLESMILEKYRKI